MRLLERLNLSSHRDVMAGLLSYAEQRVMGHGRIVFEGTPADLKGNEGVRREWLEV